VSQTPEIPFGDTVRPTAIADDIALPGPWSKRVVLSSAPGRLADLAEYALGSTGFDRAPWLAVALMCGILAWFALNSAREWILALGSVFALVILAALVWRNRQDRANLRVAVLSVGLTFALGLSAVWFKSEWVGAPAIAKPSFERLNGYVVDVEHLPARDKSRLMLAVREPESDKSRIIRLNTGLLDHQSAVARGAVVRLNARLMPPASPLLPGGYDFARTAWFEGLFATGTVVGEIVVVKPAQSGSSLRGIQRRLSAHVRDEVNGSPGSIAAAFVSGDRGAILETDRTAMRDAGLAHLLAISGLHVSSVIAAAYLITLKLLAAIPPLALRIRTPLVASVFGAGAGIAYTLLTGAQVPTVRSCAAAMLVLIALAIGREALSMRMVACAAGFVMLLWPETVVGPSFQMSFAAVLVIVALHTSPTVKAFLAPREESGLARFMRRCFMLLITGLVIEIALMPIVLFHFHRTGVYGAFANVLAIPLVTFAAMPLIAMALSLDLFGMGAPIWWLAEKSLELLLGIAQYTSGLPGSVKRLPQLDESVVLLFALGGIWIALWSGRTRVWGVLPVVAASAMTIFTPYPDILVGRDGKHAAVRGLDEQLYFLRDTRSTYVTESFAELAPVSGSIVPLANWDQAQCTPEFCSVVVTRSGRRWSLLLARNRIRIEERALAAACDRADIVIADRWLPNSCRPKWIKADRNMLSQTGGIAIYLDDERIRTVADGQGEHGWWVAR